VIRLCYSNRIEALLDALAESIARERRSLFDPVHLVVPNPLLSHFVKQGLARRLGIAANVDVGYLRGFLRGVAEATAPERPIADHDLVEGELLALFHDGKRLGSRDLQAVRGYLGERGDGAVDEEGHDRRRVQLAATVAGLFDEYAFSRPEMLAAWRSGALIAGVDEPLQRWQRELWLALFGRGGTLAARGATTLPEFFTTTPADALKVPEAVHLFGISYVARLYRQIFGALARAARLTVYAVNPCREFWEDLEPRARRKPDPRFPRRRRSEQLTLDLGAGAAEAHGDEDSAAPAAVENPLLALWGRPGRDNIRLMNQLADCDFDARFVDPSAAAPGSLLLRVQAEVLDRAPHAGGAQADGSITILPAPDQRRELEAIAAEIWRLVREDDAERARGEAGGAPPLRFSDFAVVVPPAAAGTYLPLAQAVFHEASALPHAVLDLPSAAETRVTEALGLLLSLPNGPLGRPDLLRLCMHPLVVRRFPDVDPEDLVALCEELGIVSGADRRDHAGSYLDGDRVSWEQGLTRLALGAFMSGPRSGEERPITIGGEPLLPAELPASAEPAARALAALARGLIDFAQAARGAPAPVAAHLALVRRTIASTFVAETPEEDAALGDVYAALDRIAAWAPAETPVSFRVAAELVRSRVGQAARGGHRPPEGVTIASMVPMRALPFRVVFVAGLDERQFPTGEPLGALDLRAAWRQEGDVSPREQDEYMFFETLLSARERLYLSYVARDPVTGDARGPSSTVLALLEAVGAPMTDGAVSPLVRPMPPLPRHEDDAACAVFPAAARERRAAALGRALRTAARAPVQLPPAAALRGMLAPDTWSQIAPALGWMGPLAPAEAGRARARQLAAAVSALSWADLRLFLLCPLQGSVRVLLPMRGDDEAADDAEAALREYERLDEARSETVPLLRRVAARAFSSDQLVGGADDDRRLADAYDAEAALPRLEGTLPGGVFGAAMRDRHLALLRCWRDALQALLGGPARRLAPRWFGGAPEHRRDARIEPAVPLTVPLADGTVTIEVGGATELLAETTQGGLVAVALVATASRDYPERDLLRGWLTHLALAASGIAAGRPLRTVVIRPADNRIAGPARTSDETFAPLAVEEARAHLAALAADLLGDVHDYLLPCEAVFTWRKRQAKGEAMSVAGAVRLLRDDGWTRLSSDRGPVPDARRYPVPFDERADEIVSRRFAPFFAATSGDEEDAS
jgi:exodeoxyribonuclease V gamma subunit